MAAETQEEKQDRRFDKGEDGVVEDLHYPIVVEDRLDFDGWGDIGCGEADVAVLEDCRSA